MRHLRMAKGLMAFSAAFMLFGAAAQAADETAISNLSMEPVSGKLFREVPRPVTWTVDVNIEAPYPGSPLVTPVKEIQASLPKEMSFNPDPKMPVCPDSAIGPGSNLSIAPESVIALCPDSVLGNGTAEHYLAGANGPNGPTLTDAVVIVFNGGRTAGGLPTIKVYGYSKTAATGIYMVGVLKNGRLGVSIPVLPLDSATAAFHLSIPGREESHKERRGLDPNYVRATCANRVWKARVGFVLGTRGTAGNATGTESTIQAPPISVPCTGAAGRAQLSRPEVKGSASVKAGAMAVYRVMLKNSGTATARGLEVSASGKGASGRAPAGTLAPGKSRSVKLKVRFRKPGRSKIRFKVSGARINAVSAVRRVQVR